MFFIYSFVFFVVYVSNYSIRFFFLNVERYHKSTYHFLVMDYEATHRCDEVRVICYYDNHRNIPHPGKKFLEHASGLDYSLASFCYSDFLNILVLIISTF